MAGMKILIGSLLGPFFLFFFLSPPHSTNCIHTYLVL